MKISKFMFAVAITTLSLSTNAQELTAQPTGVGVKPNTENVSSDNEQTISYSGWKKDVTTISANYLGRFGKQATLNIDIRYNIFDVGGGYTVSGIDGWHLYAGVGYRYCFNRNIYIDGAAGVIYNHSTIESKEYEGSETYYIFGKPHTRDKYKMVKHSDGAFGLYVLPRLNIVANKGFGLSIGYMMTAPKLKFDGFFDYGAVVLGIVY